MLKHVEKTNEDGNTVICSIDQNGVEQGPFEIRCDWGTIKGYYKNGKYDGPAELRSNTGFVSEHIYRDGVELSGAEAKEYLQKWKEMQKKSKEESSYYLDFTLLTSEQAWGDDALEVMKKYGMYVIPTDLTAILGCRMTPGLTSADNSACESWFASSSESGGVRIADYDGDLDWTLPNCRVISVRPALSPDEVSRIRLNNIRTINGMRIAEYGEYPQTVVDERTFLELERGYNLTSIYTTEKSYTFDSVGSDDLDSAFKEISYPEYELNGKKYIRVPGKPFDSDNMLSTGEPVEDGKPYWIEVQPIEWLMDPSGWMVSKKCLFAGIQFNPKGSYDGNFKNTFMKQYLDTYFAKEMAPGKVANREIIKGLNERLSEISDLEKVKKTVKPARTPERTDILARITRVRKAKALLSKAAQKAHKEGNEATLQEIVEMAKPFAVREAVIRDKFHKRQAERRAKRGRE